MKSLVIVNQKGGVGKTALVINLAYFLGRSGYNVAVIDTDEQANTTTALSSPFIQDDTFDVAELVDKRDIATSAFYQSKKLKIAPPTKNITLFGADKTELILMDNAINKKDLGKTAINFRQRLADLENAEFDICLFDMPGKTNIRFHATLYSIDLVLAPILLDGFSFQGVKDLLTNVANAKEYNDTMEFLGILPNKYESSKPSQKTILTALRKHYPEIILPFTIGSRTSINAVSETGIPLWKNKSGAARLAIKELSNLADFIKRHIDKES